MALWISLLLINKDHAVLQLHLVHITKQHILILKTEQGLCHPFTQPTVTGNVSARDACWAVGGVSSALLPARPGRRGRQVYRDTAHAG